MSRKLIAVLLALVMAMSMTAVVAEEETSFTLVDMMDREITFTEPVTSIVALTPSDCETLYAIGSGDALVGRGEYCDFPAEVMDLPVVQSGADMNVEQVIALKPQVVLMGTMAHTEEQVKALEAAGVKVVVSDADDIAGVYECIMMVGAMMGKDAEAEALIDSMEAVFRKVEDASEETEKTVYFEVSPLQWGLWTAGANTFMDELAEMCGLKNAFADVDGWAEISEEQVLERDPDYIVTISMYFGEGPKPVDEILARKGWENLKAVTAKNVFNADSNEVSRPGPRLADAALALYEFVNGEALAAEEAAK